MHLLGGTGVHPDHGVAERISVFIHRKHGDGLGADADAPDPGYNGRIYSRCDLPKDFACVLPPFICTLLDHALARKDQVVFPGSTGQSISVFIHENGLYVCGAQVHTDQIIFR